MKAGIPSHVGEYDGVHKPPKTGFAIVSSVDIQRWLVRQWPMQVD